MKDYSEIAKDNFIKGYNCCQAVVLAFADDLDLDKETLLKASSSFGGGMGRLREVCGAVSGMFMVAGLKEGYTGAEDKEGKMKHYQLIQSLAAEFREKNRYIVCRELLGNPEATPVPSERTSEFYKKRPCVELVGDAAEIVSKLFK